MDLRVSQPTDLTAPKTSSAPTVRYARKLEFFTLAWNLVEAAVAIGSGAVADSAALIAFGIDSLIESSSSVVLLWRLHGGDRGEARERRALRLVGLRCELGWNRSSDAITHRDAAAVSTQTPIGRSPQKSCAARRFPPN